MWRNHKPMLIALAVGVTVIIPLLVVFLDEIK